MFDIFVRSHFSAGHHLRNYPGNCEHPHGHNWKIEVTIRATELDELGMAIDFRVAKDAVKKVIDTLDHRDLNEHPDFKDKNPSSENIAIYIFENLKKGLSTDRYVPYSVEVRETDNCGVIYREDNSPA
jgi:6-pyruvoyltetrahydropterin/6-carboxytetrahydropterin synthase